MGPQHSKMELLAHFPTRHIRVGSAGNVRGMCVYGPRIKMPYGLHRTLWATCMENGR